MRPAAPPTKRKGRDQGGTVKLSFPKNQDAGDSTPREANRTGSSSSSLNAHSQLAYNFSKEVITKSVQFPFRAVCPIVCALPLR